MRRDYRPTEAIDFFSDAYELIVQGLAKLGYDDDISLENFKGTANRATGALLEMILPKSYIHDSVSKEVTRTFPCLKAQEMVVQKHFRVISMCPHHLLPIDMQVTIGYIPNEKVLGLSKIVRIARLLGKQPVLQEDYTNIVASVFMERVQAVGVGVHVVGEHSCMKFRGVALDNPQTITTVLRGNFLEDPNVKREFMSYLK